MTAKKGAVVVGHIDCEACGSRAAVYQSIKSYLYTRCGECGIDQRNGQRVQERIWFGMEPTGAEVVRPVNVGEKPTLTTAKKAAAAEPEAPAPEAEKKGAPWGLLAAAGAVVGIIFVGVR